MLGSSRPPTQTLVRAGTGKVPSYRIELAEVRRPAQGPGPFRHACGMWELPPWWPTTTKGVETPASSRGEVCWCESGWAGSARPANVGYMHGSTGRITSPNATTLAHRPLRIIPPRICRYALGPFPVGNEEQGRSCPSATKGPVQAEPLMGLGAERLRKKENEI